MVKQTSTFFTNTDITKDIYFKLKAKAQQEIKKSLKIIDKSKKSVNDESILQKKQNGKNEIDQENQLDCSRMSNLKNQNNMDQTIGKIRLEDQSVQQCLVCFELPPDAVLMDCGHGGLCYVCATDIWKKQNECYLCRQPITKIIQLDVNHGFDNIRPILNIYQMQNNQDQISQNVSILNQSELNIEQ